MGQIYTEIFQIQKI